MRSRHYTPKQVAKILVNRLAEDLFREAASQLPNHDNKSNEDDDDDDDEDEEDDIETRVAWPRWRLLQPLLEQFSESLVELAHEKVDERERIRRFAGFATPRDGPSPGKPALKRKPLVKAKPSASNPNAKRRISWAEQPVQKVSSITDHSRCEETWHQLWYWRPADSIECGRCLARVSMRQGNRMCDDDFWCWNCQRAEYGEK
mmetsp:Transcript_21135/g.31621  ORF Transcript_21135/g.31621 Transcript_21135/m.31621 type:complete len:203 (+) Transcript_21135:184-792(+)